MRFVTTVLSKKAVTPPASAANCKRRLATKLTSSISPITSAGCPLRSPSSMAQSRSCFFRVSTKTICSGSNPKGMRPGPYTLPVSLLEPRHHRIGLDAARRPASAAAKPTAAAVPFISWRAARGRPPQGNAESSMASPKRSGTMSCCALRSASTAPISVLSVPSTAARSGAGTWPLDGKTRH